MAAAIDEDEELNDAFDNISIQYIPPNDAVSLIKDAPSPPKDDNVSMLASMPPAPTNKPVASKKQREKDRTEKLLEIYLSKFKANEKNIAIDYLQRALKKENDLVNAMFLAKTLFDKDIEKARKPSRFKASARGSTFSDTTKRTKRKHPTKRNKRKHPIKRKRNTIRKKKVSKQ